MPNQSHDTAEDMGAKDVPPPESLVEFFRRSPLAKAIADGEISPDVFERDREPPRDIDLSDIDSAKV